MIKIREGTFETNSSSTHSIVICTRKEFEDWKSGKCLFNTDTDKFVFPDTSKEEEYRKEAVENYRRNKDPDPYSIKWDDLTKEAQEKYIDSHVKYRIKEQFSTYSNQTYDGYRYYYKEGCEYTERFFTTEHGDQVVAFGKGGYD